MLPGLPSQRKVRVTTNRIRPLSLACLVWMVPAVLHAEVMRAMRFQARNPSEARAWQENAREKLFRLMMGGQRPRRVPLDPKILRHEESLAGGYAIEELTLQTIPDRRVHAWLVMPLHRGPKLGGILALHGHGATGEKIVRGLDVYWYGRAVAEMGYVVIAPDIGSHDLQHKDWSLMGERVWDAIRCIDYLVTRPEVDPERIAVAGLSLGGETTMYVAALDERVKAADSSGWLTTIENMKHGHCPCWNFNGLETNFDFSDIFGCVAPRRLICEVGQKEKAPGGFPVPVAQAAFEELRSPYRVFGAEANAVLTIHNAGHVFNGRDFWPVLHETLRIPYPWDHGRIQNTEELLRRGEIARRCFVRALGVVDGWWKLRDSATGLYPRRLGQPVWAPNDNAADMFPFLSLTAYLLAPDRLKEILQILPRERALTSRIGALPDWYSIPNRAFYHPTVDTARLIFNAAEYCKDGLLPMTEVMGKGPWTDRMLELVDAIFEHAPVDSDFGKLPANDTEVNGETLQVLSRLHAMTRDAKYLRWAERIGDAYCFEVLPRNGGLPAHRWDFTRHRPITDEFSLNDHGNEIVGGLSELYVAALAGAPEKALRYRDSLTAMTRRLLEKALNSDRLWVQRLRASTAEVLDASVPDTWGYALSGVATLSTAMREPSGIEAAQRALSLIDQGRYLDWGGADSYADSIEGALVLLNRFSVPSGFAWLDKILPIFLGKQRDDGIVEGWYGDGNYARTALMAGLYYTQGLRCNPWSPGIQLGAVRNGETLHAALGSKDAWKGLLLFDRPRHRLHLGLPSNYPRLNEFPEWFTAEPDSKYEVKLGRERVQSRSGAELALGIPAQVQRGEVLEITVRPR